MAPSVAVTASAASHIYDNGLHQKERERERKRERERQSEKEKEREIERERERESESEKESEMVHQEMVCQITSDKVNGKFERQSNIHVSGKRYSKLLHN